MNTIKHTVLALAAGLWAAHGVAADRVAPVFPEPTTFTPGEAYYLYNVGAGKFLSADDGLTFADTGAEVLITAAKEGGYNVQFTSTGRYLRRNGQTTVSTDNYSSSTYCNWAITLSGDAYTIQTDESCTSYYNADQFLGWDGGENTTLNPALASSAHVTWQLIDDEAGAYYCAKLDLYNALQAMDAYDYNVDKFETIYSDAGSTTEELAEAAAALTAGLELTQSVELAEWSDYPIFFENDMEHPWEWWSSQIRSDDYACKLTATIVVDEDATLTYRIGGYYDDTERLTVSVDGKQVQLLCADGQAERRFFIPLSSGKHVIVWERTYGIHGTGVYGIGVERTPSITVNLLEPGSLGTEILYHVNHLNDVRRLKIVGKMNDDDWAKIDMMTNLFSLDLSEAEVTEIPDGQFKNNSTSSDDAWTFFHEIKLPKTLKKIGFEAFLCSQITDIVFPESLNEIGNEAFSTSMINEAFLPQNVTSIGSAAFVGCAFLKSISLPQNIREIPESVFNGCPVLDDSLRLPEGLEIVGERAFSSPNLTITYFPESLKEIGNWAFSDIKNDTIILRSKELTYMGRDPLTGPNLVYGELPVAYASQFRSTDGHLAGVFGNSRNLKTIVLRCPTMVETDNLVGSSLVGQITLKVPSYLVNTYKLDEYWYTYGNIEGFSTADVKDWTISRPLTLGARDRFEGTPNMSIVGQGRLKVNGETAMALDNFYTETNQNNADYSSVMLSNCDNITIQGTYHHGFYASANSWYFISLPFDITVGDIELQEGAQKAVRYYDGAERAANGAGNSWKDYADDDVIPAGTGFILQTSKTGWLRFYAMENESKQYVVANKEFGKQLAENPSETVANSGWNLVGNPYQTFYNINHLNFTAPITVWNIGSKRYDAYSVIDDEFVLTPNQAFFVQCPEEVSSISFPLEGRQLTEEIVSAQVNARPRFGGEASARRLVDLNLLSGSLADRTRIVLNDEASAGYDLSCDASKFMSMDATVPQLYSLGADGTAYAINERPVADGRVKLGLYLPQDGAYTLSLARNQADEAWLKDLETGAQTDLTAGDYHFTAEAGQLDGRFELLLRAEGATAIGEAVARTAVVKAVAGGVTVENATGLVSIFTAGGELVHESRADGDAVRVGLPSGLYLVKVDGCVEKVVVD